MVAAVATAWLLLWAAACTQSEQDFYDFKAVNIRGKLVSLEKYRGSFGQQEPDSNREIENFARRTYSVSFPMFSKIAVTGTGAHPAFKYLTQTSGKEPTWNFWKYLVAPDGKVVGAWDPTVPVEEIKPRITEQVMKLILQKREDL
ncbi:glutathione peroxidase 7 isoform X1 [Rattus norvegicus]|uniref:glutathione peroxidase 7 isoform X1 n=1 Tax=Rattus norvegicus TaxID=10116 RepID=UPI001916FC62|nr:glutathione peroxidase 7 isoform X1 [Rattus norvegicus]